MCSPDYHQTTNGLMVTHTLGHMTEPRRHIDEPRGYIFLLTTYVSRSSYFCRICALCVMSLFKLVLSIYTEGFLGIFMGYRNEPLG